VKNRNPNMLMSTILVLFLDISMKLGKANLPVVLRIPQRPRRMILLLLKKRVTHPLQTKKTNLK